MNPGKVSNSILKRSVLKQIKKREEYAAKPAIGVDCAYISLQKKDKPAVVSAAAAATGDIAAKNPVQRAANNIYAGGGIPVAAECTVLLPLSAEEAKLREIMETLQKQCEPLGIQISGGHTQGSAAVLEPVVTVTVIGLCDGKNLSAKNIHPGQDVILTKWIGISGIRQIIAKNRPEILRFYREDVIEKAQGNAQDLSVGEEAFLAAQAGVTGMHDVSEGGIFAALWDMAEAGKVGLDIDFKKIPVRQEIIEICEIFDANPYELESCGALLMTADNGHDIIKILSDAGIKASVIGRTTADHNKILRNDDEVRYLDTPNRDEVYRFI